MMTGADKRTTSLETRSYAGTSESLSEVRGDVCDWFLRGGLSAEAMHRAELIVSELATNAIEAGPGLDFDVSLEFLAPGTTLLTVANSATLGTLIPDRTVWKPVDPLSRRGRGLAIVASLADAVDVVVNTVDRVEIAVRIDDPVLAVGPSDGTVQTFEAAAQGADRPPASASEGATDPEGRS